jgi:ribonucleoside-diphosphate reductase alpha chain
MLVIKRDGRKVQWDQARIERAAVAAGVPIEHATAMALTIRHNADASLETELSVETISDRLEALMMDRGFTDEARKFILFRDQRKRQRRDLPAPVEGELSRYIQAAKYARERNGRYETYPEALERVITMHENRINKFPEQARRDLEAMRVLPSMRSLQFGGKAIEFVNERMFNCCYTHLNRWWMPAESLWMLLCGAGVGYSIQRCHVDQIPATVARINRKRVLHHTVEDSIRGWRTALEVLLESYFVTGCYVEFDYHLIRPEGSELVTSGGLAPGHLPLRDMLEAVRGMIPLGRHLRPFEWHCIMTRMADAVLSGGIRRSSLIALFSKEDDEMWTCKTGEWWKERPYLANANNSVHYVRGEDLPDFARLVACAMEYGEPGFFIGETRNHGCNPCAEIGFQLPETSPDFAGCNLTEVCVPRCQTKDEFIVAVESATILGCLQALYMDWDVPNGNARDERLLGVSLTGICDQEIPDDWLEDGKKAARVMADEWCHYLNIPRSLRICTVKPSGTASLLLECSAGIHPPHAEYYFRRVTANPNEPLAQAFREANPRAVEEKPNGDWALVFPMRGRKVKMSGVEHLELIRRVYKKWVYDPGVCHNVSATVTLDDPDAILVWLYNNHHDIRAISFISPVGDKTYAHAPQEAIVSDADMARWTDIVSNWKTVDYGSVPYRRTAVQPEPACSGGACYPA